MERAVKPCRRLSRRAIVKVGVDGPGVGGQRLMESSVRETDGPTDRRVGLLRGSIDPAKCRRGAGSIDPGQGLRPRLTDGLCCAGCEEN